jgi:hypothetical protein
MEGRLTELQYEAGGAVNKPARRRRQAEQNLLLPLLACKGYYPIPTCFLVSGCIMLQELAITSHTQASVAVAIGD